MAANPVFPLYYNDLRGSTEDWTDEELGAYIRLLIYQWDKGSLPNDSQRLARIVTSFERTWDVVGRKFDDTGAGLQNRRLEEVRDKILKYSKRQSENARKRSQTPSQSSAKHPAKTQLSFSSSISYNNSLCHEMMKIVSTHFPHYPTDEQKDFTACLQIAYKIAKKRGWDQESVLNGNMKLTLEAWEKIISFAASDEWFSKRSVEDFNKEFQRISQAMASPKNKKEFNDYPSAPPLTRL